MSPRPTIQFATLAAALLGATALLLGGCGKADAGPAGPAPWAGGANFEPEFLDSLVAEYDLDIPMVTFEWDPGAGDPEVSAELGGPGFTGEGWQTRMTFQALGSPEAVRGGQIVLEIPSWPDTFRRTGENWNTSFNYRADDLCFEGLLRLHDNTLEWVPWLATHWQIEAHEDGTETYRYRINPEARFSDGEEVTAEDFVFTWDLFMDPGLKFPSNLVVWGKFNQPVAVSKYILEVTSKVQNWRNFLYFSNSLVAFPEHELSGYTADEYLDEYQNRYHAVTGPYTLDEEATVMNQHAVLKRRDDWWAEGNPAWAGLWNIDSYKCMVVQDPTLAFEKMKKGELDYYVIPKAQWWAEELGRVDLVQRGVLVPMKFWNDAPKGYSGLALNTTRPPFDDVRVREALALLTDRQTYIEKLFFNEYAAQDSYWQYGDYRNPDNGVVLYDPREAVRLLGEAGFTEIGPDGIRLRPKDDLRLSFELMYRSPLSESYLTIFQQDCKDAGVEVDLRRADQATHWTSVRTRDYDAASMAWGALIFPNPETSFNGELAKVDQNNNITAFADDRVDALLVEYDEEGDVDRRAAIIREIDGIVFAQHPYVLHWYNPAERIVIKNKFAMPSFGAWRTPDRQELMYSWWIDPELEANCEAAMDDEAVELDTPPNHQRFWQAWNRANTQ